MLAWLNGQFIDLADARISAFDAGFQHGVGLFETMLARDGAVLGLEKHLARLEESARTLRLTERLHVDALADAVNLALERNQLAEARIRLTLSGGDLNLLRGGSGAGHASSDTAQKPAPRHDPTILIHIQPITRYPEAFFEQGVTVTIADSRLNPLDPFQGHKTLNYWPRLSALQQAAAAGAAESLWFSVSNHLCGGSVSNIFLVKDGLLMTPIARGEEQEVGVGTGATIPSPVLPGVTRAMLLEAAEELGLQYIRRMLDYDDLREADEVFLTNSSWGVLPVVRVEQARIGQGDVGPVTKGLRQAWLDW